MLDNKTIQAFIKGLKGNTEAIIAFACLLAGPGLWAAGAPILAALFFPLGILGLYTVNRLGVKKCDIRQRELEFEKERERNRVKIGRKKRRLEK